MGGFEDIKYEHGSTSPTHYRPIREVDFENKINDRARSSEYRNSKELDRETRRLLKVGAIAIALLEVVLVKTGAYGKKSEYSSKPPKPSYAITRQLEEHEMPRKITKEKVRKTYPADALIQSPDFIKKVKENMPDYIVASIKYDIPVAAYIAIHEKESGLSRKDPGNGQGPFQIYSRLPGMTDEEITGWPSALNAASKKMREIAEEKGLILTKDTKDMYVLDRLCFAYNGESSQYTRRAAEMGFDPETQGYKGSPYVMGIPGDQSLPLQVKDGVPMDSNDPSTYTIPRTFGTHYLAEAIFNDQKISKLVIDSYKEYENQK